MESPSNSKSPMRNSKRQAPGNGESEPAPPYIPTELLRSIMARLPVKSLCRFKCVSPLWNSIISDPQFEQLQFDCSRPSLLITAYSRNNDLDFFSKIFFQPSAVRLPLPLPQPNVQSLKPYQQSKSVGGLILDRPMGSWLRIYNPSTGEFSGDIVVPGYLDDGIWMGFKTSMFGYDPIDRTHKILGMWIELRSSAESRLKVKTRYSVLTLDKQMQWRSLAGDDSHESIDSTRNNICLDGVIYCFGSPDNSEREWCFGGFDVNSEVLRWVRIPPSIETCSVSSRIIEFNSRAAFYCPWDDTNDEIILWLFQGFDEQRDPWRRITIAMPLRWIEGTVPSGELLCWEANLRSVFPITLFYYNTDGKIIRTESVLPDAAEIETLYARYEYYAEVLVSNHVESIKSLKYISN